jgi:hypothetical protein
MMVTQSGRRTAASCGTAACFRDEAALYDNTFQQYGQIFVMNADGTGKRMLTDSLWEDSMPLYIPAKLSLARACHRAGPDRGDRGRAPSR